MKIHAHYVSVSITRNVPSYTVIRVYDAFCLFSAYLMMRITAHLFKKNIIMGE